MRGFSLLELIIVVIVIGILATFALPQFAVTKERALDKEAKANLKLIFAAEKIYRMEYITFSAATDTSEVNNNLKLNIPTGGTPSWNYKVDGVTASTFMGKAQRGAADSRVWCIDQGVDEPYQGGCAW